MHTPRKVAIIGTAGRDKTKPMTKSLWLAMVTDLHRRVQPGDHLVSGGAAWADHLAVHAYLEGWCSGLTLYLPAPFQQNTFLGPASSSGSAANWYHLQFTHATGVKGLEQIHEAIMKGAEVHWEPPSRGYGGMFARNLKVASNSTSLIAYTFGEGAEPADGGTKDTWNKFNGEERIHVPLHALASSPSGFLPRNHPSLTIVSDWKEFCEWVQEAGYGEEYLDVNDGRCLDLQEKFLAELAETARSVPGAAAQGA